MVDYISSKTKSPIGSFLLIQFLLMILLIVPFNCFLRFFLTSSWFLLVSLPFLVSPARVFIFAQPTAECLTRWKELGMKRKHRCQPGSLSHSLPSLSDSRYISANVLPTFSTQTKCQQKQLSTVTTNLYNCAYVFLIFTVSQNWLNTALVNVTCTISEFIIEVKYKLTRWHTLNFAAAVRWLLVRWGWRLYEKI